MTDSAPLLLGFAAWSGTGKTTLLTRLIPLLTARDLRVGVIKHSHHDFEIDKPGKDSYQIRKAGASPVMLVSPYRRAIITEFEDHHDVDLAEQLAAFPTEGLDLLLVEGFRHVNIPKIELYRSALGRSLMYPDDAAIIAIASDQPLTTPTYLPCLDLNNIEQIAAFIIGIMHKKAKTD